MVRKPPSRLSGMPANISGVPAIISGCLRAVISVCFALSFQNKLARLAA